MAKQKASGNISGTVGELTFVTTAFGTILRSRTSLTKARVKKDPAFAGSRAASSEFGLASRASANLRRCFSPVADAAKDIRTHSRLNMVMAGIIRSDKSHVTGKRLFHLGDGRLLEGFEWNQAYVLDRIFGDRYDASINSQTGEMQVRVPGFKPGKTIRAPKMATHFSLNVAGTALKPDLPSEMNHLKGEILPLKGETGEMTFRVGAGVLEHSILVLGMGIVFYEKSSGEYHPLKEGAAFRILKTS